MRSTEHNARGFTLVEMLMAVALGLIVLAATTQLFKGGMDATILVTQSSEMQQNVRSTLNLVAKDVSMAGSGLPPGGLSLPYGAGIDAFILRGGSHQGLAGKQYVPHRCHGWLRGYELHVRHRARVGQRHGAGRAGHVTATGKASDAITVSLCRLRLPAESVHCHVSGCEPERRRGEFCASGGSSAGLPCHSVSHRNSGGRPDSAATTPPATRWAKSQESLLVPEPAPISRLPTATR